MSNFIVVDSHKSLILYVDSLQRKNAECLSFYPKSVFEREAEKRRLILGLLNGEPCGYLYMGALGIDVKIHQVCIQYDARRRLYGEMLVKHIESLAHQAKSSSITLRCGFDLEANDFWKALGYSCIAVKDGGVRRMRKINIWRKNLIPPLFADIPIEPQVGKTDASLWRKNKQKGLVTGGMYRGKDLELYRKLVIGEQVEGVLLPKKSTEKCSI